MSVDVCPTPRLSGTGCCRAVFWTSLWFWSRRLSHGNTSANHQLFLDGFHLVPDMSGQKPSLKSGGSAQSRFQVDVVTEATPAAPTTTAPAPASSSPPAPASTDGSKPPDDPRSRLRAVGFLDPGALGSAMDIGLPPDVYHEPDTARSDSVSLHSTGTGHTHISDSHSNTYYMRTFGHNTIDAVPNIDFYRQTAAPFGEKLTRPSLSELHDELDKVKKQ